LNQPDLTFPEALSRSHDKASFNCGTAELNDYFHTRVSQHIKSRITKCFVVIDRANNDKVAGFYTISAAGVPFETLEKHPAGVAMVRGFPRYQLPVFLMGRLAVDIAYRDYRPKLRLGESLLFDAIERCMESDVAGFALIVDAKAEAEGFYRKYNFVNYTSEPLKLILAFPKIKNLPS
jgi:hypothetical protein